MFLKLFNRKKYVSEQSLKWALKIQLEMNIKTIEQLHKIGITPESRLKLQFFYGTNRFFKARRLAYALGDLDYQLESVEKTVKNKRWNICGWTKEMIITPESVTNWTTLMHHIGYEYDCGFDGWGAYTE